MTCPAPNRWSRSRSSRTTDKVASYRHHELSVFGIGTELREAEWRGVVRQLLAHGLLAVQGEYQTLALTEGSGG